jgi:GT2 family glycosyltransferase
MTGITVIVPIFNGLRYLPAFFESLSSALPAGAELILVDDGSTEPVFSAVPELQRANAIMRLRNDVNLGYSVAVNRAFAESHGDLIVQLNTDLVLDAECITAMLDLIASRPRVGIVGSKLIFPSTGLIQHIGMAFGHLTHRHVYLDLPPSHPLCCKTRSMQILTGATVAMTRVVLESIGPLDEEYFNCNEDLDHCLKAVKAGFVNYTCAQSVAYHWESQSGPARFARETHSDALFWSRWGGKYEVDFALFVDEALDHLLTARPHLQQYSFELLNLTRSPDDTIMIGCLGKRWPDIATRIRPARQLNNPGQTLWLPMLLPHWVVHEPRPFIYLVDRYRSLCENHMWFETRRRVVQDEIVVDATGVALSTTELHEQGQL